MTINAQNRLLPAWFDRIRSRQTVLPRFQRFEAWSHSNVSQLFNTILHGLPAGAMLILEIGNEEPFISRTIVGAPEDGDRINEHLLDGQQRLTALWRALHNNYEKRTYFLYAKPDEGNGLPYYVDSLGRWEKVGDTELRPFWANNPAELWSRRMIPLDLCAPGDEAHERYKIWSKLAMPDANERETMSDLRTSVREKFSTFNLPFLSLPVSTSKETALDVFIRMNTTAQPLKIYDIVVAQVEAETGQSLHDLVAAAKKTSPLVEQYYDTEELILYVSALLQGKAPTNATYLAKEFGTKIVDQWEQIMKGISRAVIFLEEEGLLDAKRLPSDVVVPVLVALWAKAPEGLDAEGRARTILRRYIWSAFFSDRYERSTNSRAPVDFLELESLIANDASPTPVVLDTTKYPLPEIDGLIEAGWPTKKDRLARAILALALKHGGLDLADGSPASRTNLAKREYHHLFPDAFLQRQGRDDKSIYRSLNCALVTWQTNRNISDKEPERYLAERRTSADPDESEIKHRLASHLVPYDELVEGDYDKFLEKRAETVRDVLIKLCQTGRT